MIKTFVVIGLGAVIVFSPLAAMAQSASGTAHAGGGGSHKRLYASQRQHEQRESQGLGRTHAHDAPRSRRS